MSNKVTVTLDGRRYRLAAEEDPAYMEEVAAFVDQQLKDVRQGNQFRSGVDCATVTALNLADTLFKERATAEDLRLQLKQALDDTRKAEQKLREYKRNQRNQNNATRRNQKNGSGKADNTSQMSLPLEDE
ncbi:MAG: cell division protein ZapA [Oscillospiraceae bacterium]|nr:cell division protein ZapA [Oscillospiraceae bacterium]